MGRSNKITAILCFDGIYKARPIFVGLGGNIRQLSMGTANWLASFHGRTKGLVTTV
jgi:hypothetical protein